MSSSLLKQVLAVSQFFSFESCVTTELSLQHKSMYLSTDLKKIRVVFIIDREAREIMYLVASVRPSVCQ